MKKQICLILSILLCFCLYGCSVQPETPENPYRAVSYKSETIEDGVVTFVDLAEYDYDENGYQTEFREYRNGVLTQTNIYENDTFGNILKVTSISDGKTTVFDHNLILDDDGRILLQEASSDGVLLYTLEYTYDKNGNKASEVYTHMEDGTPEIIRNMELTYDRKGQLIREIHHNQDGTYLLYDYEAGKQVKTESYDSSDELLSYWEYTYNDKGQLIKESSYACQRHGDSRTSILTNYNLYTYDETGYVVTCTNGSTRERPVETYSVTTYDEYGNKLLQERYMDGQLYWRITQEFEPVA